MKPRLRFDAVQSAYIHCLIVIQELFATTIGPLREVTLNYDNNGRSKGIATITFQRKGDGSKAYHQYNNRLIDGS
jgi:THO complex subunit 4